MPPTPCERFNAKARRSVAGGSSHKKKKVKKPREGEGEGQGHPNANAEILVEKTEDEKEQHRREFLRQELLAAQEKPSKKKQKRLEKYIDKKLKQEERVEILKRLAQTQAELPSTAILQSSATLGSGRIRTANERAAQEEDIAVRRALDGRTGKNRRQRVRHAQHDSEDGDSEDMEMSGVVPPPARGKDRNSPIIVHDADIMDSVIEAKLERPAAQPAAPLTVGSALRRNTDGSLAIPVMAKRQPKAPKITRRQVLRLRKPPSSQAKRVDESSDFDSSDSANDTDSQEGDTDERESGGEAEGSDAESSSDAEIDADPLEPLKPAPVTGKRSFKEWAKEQINETLRPATETGEETPMTHIEAVTAFQATLSPTAKRRKIEEPQKPGAIHGPMGEKLKIPDTEFARGVLKERGSEVSAKKYVTVNRTDEVRKARMMLPVLAEEQNIVETVFLHPVTLVCGETGSGKTTQIPQFLYEAGYGSHGSDNPGMIGITQPRRVAAVSMAARVGQELSLPTSKVSYQIRYDATTAPTTSIKFMTDGVLLREMATDFLLSKYSVIIVDEAHERSLNTDILIGTLSRVIKVREKIWLEGKPGVKPLRLIIMSATLRIADFAENQTLFEVPPPIVEIPARQYPVIIHFNRKTHADYADQAIRKTIKIHSRLPPGGILVFLTGQNEITGVCKRLDMRFGRKVIEERRRMRQAAADKPAKKPKVFPEDDLQEIKPNNIGGREQDIEAEEIDLGVQGDLAADVDATEAEEDPDGLDSDTEDEAKLDKELGIDLDNVEVPMHIVPLYSLLSSEKQMRIFKPPPDDSRLVVVATNVAETSLTIPGIRYVVDCGRAKERRFDPGSGIQSFQVSWISKASAAQRAGRAGRTGPGHCYRLYSSALYENHFDQFSMPEILRTPIEGIILQMKSMYIDAVVNFPFPTPPDRLALKKAEATLTNLGALEPGAAIGKGFVAGGKITELGRSMALFPVNPRFGKMLATGMQHGCMPYVIALVSALSVGDPFLHEEVLGQQGDDEEVGDGDLELGAEFAHIKSEEIQAREIRKAKRQAFFRSQQALAGLGDTQSDALRLLAVVGAYEYAGGGIGFCEKHFLRPKAMEEIHKLRAQISGIVQTNFPGINVGFNPSISPPRTNQIKALRQLTAASFIDQVAVREDLVQPSSASGNKYSSCRSIAYRANGVTEDVFIHPSSVLWHKTPPDYVVFQEVIRSTKVWIKTVTVINPAWIAPLGNALCTFSKPIPVPPSMKNAKPGEVLVVPKYGPGWELPPIRKMKD